MSFSLSSFALRRRVTILVLFLTTLVIGATAANRIPTELIPSGFDNPSLAVMSPWENAPSREVLDKVTLPLEEELATVRGVDRQVSISSTGFSRVFLQFKQGIDLDVAYREVRDRVERAKNRLPDEVDRVIINKEDTSGIPVYILGIAVDPELADPYNLIQNRIVRPLQRLDGVAAVNVNGLLEKEILIELDREKTAAAGLNIYELGQDLAQDNFTLASGTVRDGSRKLLLRSVARYDTLEQLENRYVSDTIRLRDVAEVSFREPRKDFRVRAMSRPAVAVLVLKEGDANIKEVSNTVSAAFEALEQDPNLTGLNMITLFSQGEVIDEALSTLLDSGMIGATIAIVVMFFFLRRVRLTLIMTLAIPLSLVIGMAVMYFAGESLNLLTLLGLMICVGLLVDNSVVVAENIHRYHREGLPRWDASVRGASEVALAITMSTLTTVVVFLPVSLVAGPAQFFLLRLAIPVCVSVVASLGIALVFIPLCVYLTLPEGRQERGTGIAERIRAAAAGGLGALYDRTLEPINRIYGRWLGWFVERRIDLAFLVLATFVITIALPGRFVSVVEAQEEERAGFHFTIEMPDTYTLEETEAFFLKAEKVVEERKDELDLDGWFLHHQKTRGELQGWFRRPRTNDLSPAEATEIVKSALPVPPGVELHVGNQAQSGDGGGRSRWSVRVNGEDPEQLEEIKDALESAWVKVDGVLGVLGENDPPPNELGLVVDRERAQRYGVNPQVVAGVVGTALMGMELPKYREAGREVPVRVRYEEEDRESLTELSDFLVPSSTGELMPLGSLTDPEFLPAAETIVRRNKRMARDVTFELEEGREKETRARLEAARARWDLPEGVTFGSDAGQETLSEDLSGLYFALALSVIFIYLLMGFLFESFILPLSIIVTIPLSIIGVYWSHFLAGRDIDFLGMVAVVLLVGVVVNNGIVLIDYVNRLRHEGRSRTDALLEGTRLRFRPIMMTAITTIGGLVPLAFAGANSIGLSYTSFSITLIGGMTTATLLTLLVVPVLYTVFDDMREAFGFALRYASRRRSPRPS